MVGPDAGRVVAVMEHPLACRDRPVCQFPCGTLGCSCALPAAHLERTVGIAWPLPLPAAGRDDAERLRPEAFEDWLPATGERVAATAAETCANYERWLCSVSLPAVLAGSIRLHLGLPSA